MRNNLLIGNGFNLACGIDSLNNNRIVERFVDILIRTSIIYKILFNVNFTKELCEEHIIKTDDNIENIAGNLFTYIKIHNQQDTSLNFEMDILDIVKISALNAIFIDGNHFINMQTNKKDVLLALNRYDNIFSMNYYNEWDGYKKCKYLHGRYINNIIEINAEDKPILLYDEILYKSFVNYHDAIDELKAKNYTYPISNSRIIIFSPFMKRKQEVVNIGVHPSENDYPSDHDFPVESITLYSELDDITDIDVFGVSPYGDDDLIVKLKIINKGTIYVHNMEEVQKNNWIEKLGENNKFTFQNTSKFV